VKWDKEARVAELNAQAKQFEPGATVVSAPPHVRPRVFCASLADWLDDEVDTEWLADLLRLIHSTPHLEWLLLTKRPQSWRSRMEAVKEIDGDNAIAWNWTKSEPHIPYNVWIGTSVEDQTRADERIPALLKIPARVRFLSCEPLLGPVDLAFGHPKWRTAESYHAYIHWVICGGESGTNARPMHPDWARGLRDQCKAAGVPFLFKQWGEWAPGVAHLKRYNPAKPAEYVNEVRWVSTGKTVGITEHTKQCNLTTPLREPHRFEDGEVLAFKIGKKEAGRLLDGIEHNAFPEVAR
jgi:protein gp37